jgi:hypothetical protein
VKREMGLFGADMATDRTNTFNTAVSPRKVFRSNHRKRVAPSDPSLIKPSGKNHCCLHVSIARRRDSESPPSAPLWMPPEVDWSGEWDTWWPQQPKRPTKPFCLHASTSDGETSRQVPVPSNSALRMSPECQSNQ